ncbi:MAG: hypothetical protein HFG68_00920 [Hungatella sp.]|nr:hypothetical protein [Hungatella sp.]
MQLKYKQQYESTLKEVNRYRKKYEFMYQWMKLKQNGIELIEFFQDRKLESIAIYGMGDLGELLYKELEDNRIIKFGIDRQLKQNKIPIYSLENVKEKVDAIVITPVLITDEIEDQIYEILGEQTTFVFEEILFELSRKHQINSEMWTI